MKYYVEKSFADFEPWAGAVETHRRIIEAGKEDEAEAYLAEVEPIAGWTETGINDFLWFDGDSILKDLGITPDEDESEDESED